MVFFEVLLKNMQPIILNITVPKGGFHHDATNFNKLISMFYYKEYFVHWKCLMVANVS